MKLFALSIVTFILVSSCQKKIEDPLKSLQEKEIHSLNINLYPSNLKMINVNNDPALEEATKDIKKLHVLQIAWDDEAKKADYKEWKSKQDFNDWESVFTARIDNISIDVKAPEGRDDILFATADTGEGLFVGFLEGKFDMSKVPALMNSDLNLGPIGDFILDKEEKKAEKEKRKRIRKEVDEKMKEDSTSSNSLTTEE